MVRIQTDLPNTSLRHEDAPNSELPLGSSTERQTATDQTRSYAKARLAVHRRSACPGVKALRNTSDARRQAAKLCYRFGPLTPSARSAKPDRRRRDEERLSRSEQRTHYKPKSLLDSKSPIQVRIPLPPAKPKIRVEPRFHSMMEVDQRSSPTVSFPACRMRSSMKSHRSPIAAINRFDVKEVTRRVSTG
jgi:hypothetical protein